MGKYGYRRVSTVEQNLERQLQGLELKKIFDDKVSGKDMERPGLQKILEFLGEGDELYVDSMDRLGRNQRDLLDIVEHLIKNKVVIHFIKENFHIFPGKENDPFSKLFLSIFSALSEFERNIIRERQAEGIALAKEKGKYLGRKPTMTQEQLDEIYYLQSLGLSAQKIAKHMGMSRTKVVNYTRRNNALKYLREGKHNLRLQLK